MPKDTDLKQDIDSSLAAVQRLRERRDALLAEIKEIDHSLETLQQEIATILGSGPAPTLPEPLPFRLPSKKTARKPGEWTVNDAVLDVIQEARKDLSKSEIRIRAMRLAGPFSESALNAALGHWVDEEKIINTSRGCYAAS